MRPIHRLAYCLALLTVAIQPVTAQVGSASVRGIVTQFNTTEPLKDAKVKLTPGIIADSPVAPDSALPGVRSTNTLQEATIRQQARARSVDAVPPILSDATGHFDIQNVAPGTYTLSVEREGYFGNERRDGSFAPVATGVITVAGSQPSDVTVQLIRGGILSGHVTDPTGQPASNIAVAPFQTIYRDGRLTLIAIANSVTTDDRGTYRLAGLAPGNYYIAAVPPPPSAIPNPRDAWARTFYPSMTDPSAAVLFEVKPNTEVSPADIAIRSTGSFKVSGRLSPNTGSQSFLVIPRGPLVDETVPTQFPNIAGDAARQNGGFEIRIPEGAYDIYSTSVSIVEQQLRMLAGRASLDVRNFDLMGVNLNVTAGTNVLGQIVIPQDPPSINPSALKVGLRVLDNTPSAVTARVGAPSADSSGNFALKGVPDGLYTLSVQSLPLNAYVADILDSGMSVFDSGFEVGRNSLGTLQVKIGTDAQEITGVVVDAQRKPMENVTVALIPPAQRRQNPTLYKSATTGPAGNFRLIVPPGEYKLLAWEAIQPTAWMNAQFVSKYEDQGVPVNVKSGPVSGIQIPVIPKGQ